jgi:hypothetical protein
MTAIRKNVDCSKLNAAGVSDASGGPRWADLSFVASLRLGVS